MLALISQASADTTPPTAEQVKADTAKHEKNKPTPEPENIEFQRTSNDTRSNNLLNKIFAEAKYENFTPQKPLILFDIP